MYIIKKKGKQKQSRKVMEAIIRDLKALKPNELVDIGIGGLKSLKLKVGANRGDRTVIVPSREFNLAKLKLKK